MYRHSEINPSHFLWVAGTQMLGMVLTLWRENSNWTTVLHLFSGFALHLTALLSHLNRFGIISCSCVLLDFFVLYFISEILNRMVMKCNETEVLHFRMLRVLAALWISQQEVMPHHRGDLKCWLFFFLYVWFFLIPTLGV